MKSARLFHAYLYWKGQHAKLFHLNKHPTTIGFHLDKLLKADLIEKVKVGKEMKYRLKDTYKIFTFLIIYNYELSDNTVNIWLNSLGLFSPKKIDTLINIFWEICPHPYHV